MRNRGIWKGDGRGSSRGTLPPLRNEIGMLYNGNRLMDHVRMSDFMGTRGSTHRRSQECLVRLGWGSREVLGTKDAFSVESPDEPIRT